ncbi:MAG: sigma 54-interacting transcriptional regulator, partial [Pseudomonadota bacterium]
AQTRLLRALQSGEISRVGGKGLVKLDVRIVAATNQNFEQLIADGKFREDLYYRINVVPINLPALRERVSDIPALAAHFLNLALSEGLPRKSLSEEAMTSLSRHSWRGNVRELKNVIYRAVVTAREEELSESVIRPILKSQQNDEQRIQAAEDFEHQVKSIVSDLIGDQDEPAAIYGKALEKFERPLLEETLNQAGGNQIKAAKILGINRNTLRKKLTEYNIDPAQLR